MQDAARSALDAWDNFYVIVGSSAAALTGLQFVVITLVSEARRATSTAQIGAFSTPTIVHFCAALLVAATISAPWPGLLGVAFMIALCGLAGLIYTAVVVRRATHQTGYTMVAEDWTWHVALPAIAYGTLLVAAASLVRQPFGALFTIAGATLLLVYIGIHNAWDTTTYVAVNRVEKPAESDDAEPASESSESSLPPEPAGGVGSR